MTKRLRMLVCLFAVILSAGTAHAAVTCSISVSGSPFGIYDSIGNQDRDTSTVISVTCSGDAGENVSYTLSLSAGNGSYSNRQLQWDGTVLNYNLYTDISRSQVWGDGTGSTSVVSDSYTLDTSPVTRNYTVYGRIFKGQSSAVAGVYTDDVTVTLTH